MTKILSIPCLALTSLLLSVSLMSSVHGQSPKETVKVGIARLEHGHINGFLSRYQNRKDLTLAGIYEPDTALAHRFAERYNLDSSLFFTSLKAMLREKQPDGVAIYSNTYEHKELVETIAAAGTHIMLEKPLAVNMSHARAMKKAVTRNQVHLVTNYETSWYPSNHYIYNQVSQKQTIGDLRKMIIHSGHRGPKEIGVTDPFLSWLTNPKLNGGGALTDFGCYGANLVTWLMNNERPLTVTAITQQLKNDPIYASVDDEATIILTYPDAQAIIQASWNWPYSRKDMEVYGTDGIMHALNAQTVEMQYEGQARTKREVSLDKKRYGNPLSYFKAVIQGKIEPYGLSSLKNNMIVTEILDAARRSAKTGKTISLE